MNSSVTPDVAKRAGVDDHEIEAYGIIRTSGATSSPQGWIEKRAGVDAHEIEAYGIIRTSGATSSPQGWIEK